MTLFTILFTDKETEWASTFSPWSVVMERIFLHSRHQ